MKKHTRKTWLETFYTIVPKHSIIPLLLVLVWNMLLYEGSMYITRNWYHYNIESKLDQSIPLVPWTVSIYFGCYLFWAVNYVLCARQEKKEMYRFFGADMLGKLICFVVYLIFPTTNVRPEIVGNSVWDMLMRLLYEIDMPSNLFPSIHCLVSWFCFIGLRGKPNIPKWYQICSCLMAVAVFISTLTTKQHVLIDVISGVLLAEFCYFVMGKVISGLKIIK